MILDRYDSYTEAYLALLDGRGAALSTDNTEVLAWAIENPGFSDAEREKMTELLAAGFTDTFRYLYPETVTYSWWSYRFRAREKNVGWRIDYFIISDRLKDKLVEAEILTEVMGSDHCPVTVCMDI